MAPQFVKPEVKTNKNDVADAEAICEAVCRPNMRFVPIKNVEQQAILSVHRARQGFVKARTAQGKPSHMETYLGGNMSTALALRVIYAAGPGDVVGTYHHWRLGRDDPREVAVTYSSQFFDTCSKLRAKALVISNNSGQEVVRDDDFQFVSARIPFQRSKSSVLFHLGQVWYALRLSVSALLFRADVVVVSELSHWYVLSLLAITGVRVVPTLHCTFWPLGLRSAGRAKRILQYLNGWFWRRWAWATIAISPECGRQVETISGSVRGPILQARPLYRLGIFDSSSNADGDGKFHVFYAGRIERNKGIFDIVAVAERLHRQYPGQWLFELAGQGSAYDELAEFVRSEGLSVSIKLLGALEREEMVAHYRRCRLVIIPTTDEFCEGLNKVAVEAVLAGRPLVISQTIPAGEILGGAAIQVPPGDIEGYMKAILQICHDETCYRRMCQANSEVQRLFYDHQYSWGVALKTILSRATDTHA